jgi:pyruvate-formate lyase-activating enzyme
MPDQNTWCPLPFRHVFVEPRGVKPCCSYTRTANTTVKQWLHSPELQALQTNIINNVVDPGCRDCVNGEQLHGTSTRLGAIREYGTEKFNNTEIDYVDYRSSNVCNFKCRSCEPYFSSGIAVEARFSELLASLYQIPPEKTASTSNKEWLLQNLPTIKRLMITGGEPTLLPEVKQIVDRIRREQLPTQIIMITNGSFRDPYWLEAAREMPNLNFTVSIDAVGATAEIIRYGTQWSQIKRNIQYLAENSHSLNFSTVITSLNLFHLIPLFNFVQEINSVVGLKNGRSQFIQVCNHPQYLSPVNWPDDLRQQALNYVDQTILTVTDTTTLCILDDLHKNISDNNFDQQLWLTGERYNYELDRLRNQDHRSLYVPSF